ncbi:MAG: cytochrome c biogenesis protein CcdA [Dehalococcoidia bacterium]
MKLAFRIAKGNSREGASIQGSPLNGVSRKQSVIRLGIFIAVIGGVVAAMAALLSVRSDAEGGLASLSEALPFGYAFGAGMVASVNPCGFFMLPSYVAYNLGTQEEGFYQSPAPVRLFRALVLALVATTGFIAIFSLVGYIISLGGNWLISAFPIGGLIIGIAMALVGLWLFATHKPLGIMAASRVTITPQRNLRNVFLFGIAYAVGSLSCTLPIFLVVVGSAIATQGLADSFAQFISYSMGMGVILIAVTVGAALFRGAVARSLKGLMPHVHTISALFLVGAGAYIAYYWIKYGDIFS